MRSPVLKNSNIIKTRHGNQEEHNKLIMESTIHPEGKRKLQLIAEAIKPYLAHAADMLSELEKMTIQQSVSTVTKQLHRLETVCKQKFFKETRIKSTRSKKPRSADI